jgi:hypothetical protein
MTRARESCEAQLRGRCRCAGAGINAANGAALKRISALPIGRTSPRHRLNGWLSSALLLPDTLFGGLDYFNVYGGSGGRSFASFSQHYAALAARFQIGAVVPNPWSETSAYMVRHFPGAEGLPDVLLDHFPRYVEFVALSCVRGLFRAAYVTNYAALVIPILVFAGYRARIAPSSPLEFARRRDDLSHDAVIPGLLG